MDFQNNLVLDQRVGIITSLDADRASNTWHQVKFDVPFSEDKKVVVIPKTQTYNGAATPNLRIQNVTRLGFEIRFDELIGNSVDTSLADGSHASEAVGWVAYGFYPASADSTSTQPTPGKEYYLIAKHSGKPLAVEGASTANGAKVVQWENQKVDHFKFKLQDAGDGYYYIVAKHSGKGLAVSGVSKDNQASIVQWDVVSQDNHKFKLQDAGDGYYYIVAKHSGKGLAVYGVSKDNGAAVVQWDVVAQDNHKWKFEAV